MRIHGLGVTLGLVAGSLALSGWMPQGRGPRTYSNPKFHYTLRVPKGWNIEDGDVPVYPTSTRATRVRRACFRKTELKYTSYLSQLCSLCWAYGRWTNGSSATSRGTIG